MSESNDFTPSSWGGDFKKATDEYAKKAVSRARDYADPVVAKEKVKELLPQSITTKSPRPLLINLDTTGSMGDWPAIICGKLGYLDVERKEYLGEDGQVSFGATGDAYTGEQYPVQVRPFAKGEGMKTRIGELVIEKGGGGTMQESYEKSALYYARNVSMPKAVIKPILIFIGDESPYPTIPAGKAKQWCYVDDGGEIKTSDVFKELTKKYSVHFIRKPYGGGTTSNVLTGTDKQVYDNWAALIGPDRIWDLPAPERVVDVIFGILARETGRVKYFKEELTGRQTKEQVKTVLTALRMDKDEDDGKARGPLKKAKRSGKSVLKKPGKPGKDGGRL